jgi:hypothetical protein
VIVLDRLIAWSAVNRPYSLPKRICFEIRQRRFLDWDLQKAPECLTDDFLNGSTLLESAFAQGAVKVV